MGKIPVLGVKQRVGDVFDALHQIWRTSFATRWNEAALFSVLANVCLVLPKARVANVISTSFLPDLPDFLVIGRGLGEAMRM